MSEKEKSILQMEYWMLLDYWTVWEATVLIHLGNPDEFSYVDNLEEPFPEWYKMIKRGLISGNLKSLNKVENTNSVMIEPENLISWLTKRNYPLDSFFQNFYVERGKPILENKARVNDKLKIQTMGLTVWSNEPNMPLDQMKKNSAIKKINLSKPYKASTYRGWLKEVDPRSEKFKKGGRPKKEP